MSLNIGKVAKLFGLLPETLRYYEQEGFLSPRKNQENGYRQYDFEDLFLLTDLLFYRDIGIPIKDIKAIFDGMPAEDIFGLIAEKKQEINQRMERLNRSLTKLSNWEQLHRESLDFLGKFDIRPMPVALREEKFHDDYAQMMAVYQSDAQADHDLAFFLTFSFFCDFKEGQDPPMHRYIVLDKTVAKDLSFDFAGKGLAEESAPECLFTVAAYEPDAAVMLAPLLAYAEKEGISLTGQVYGRQSVNIYGGDTYREYYRVYAPISKK